MAGGVSDGHWVGGLGSDTVRLEESHFLPLMSGSARTSPEGLRLYDGTSQARGRDPGVLSPRVRVPVQTSWSPADITRNCY